MDSNCKLCLQPATLRRSHIVPEFLHKDVYGSGHAAQSVNAAYRRSSVGLRIQQMSDRELV